MPLVQQCPACHQKINVPDELENKDVRCPNCGVAFQCGPAIGSSTSVPRQALPEWFVDMLEPRSPGPDGVDLSPADSASKGEHVLQPPIEQSELPSKAENEKYCHEC